MLHEKLRWRYATKKMDPARAVPEAKVDAILEAVRLAPTSSGLQPFEVLVVTDPHIRAEIRKVAWDQAQITEGSHLLVFAAWDTYTEARIDRVVERIAAARGGLTDGVRDYYARLKQTYLARPDAVNFDHAARQAYIAFGIALTAAAFEGVDATPMEGFDPEAVDEILGLKARGLRSVTLMPIGYRDAAGDGLVNLPKVRADRAELVSEQG